MKVVNKVRCQYENLDDSDRDVVNQFVKHWLYPPTGVLSATIPDDGSVISMHVWAIHYAELCIQLSVQMDMV